TSSATEAAASAGISLVRPGGDSPKHGLFNATHGHDSPEVIFNSPKATQAKVEIARAARKLWERQYVDGNGGNLSYRISDKYVLCTPTMLSKGDITPDDICMVDMDANQVAGKRKRTSEIKVHLEIMKAQPKALSCIHAHPPYITAYALVGMVPPVNVICEAEVFVGQVAYSPYETTGSKEVAEKLIPLAKDHNTILMGNHGMLCWADSVTHAEWYVEII
ncbi:MAG: class II aldolase/adducin family protein, partial [Chitinivibrionales bacterium]|nr:class II aldolase/adducin family protein [Chitinivibrionales bacterium]